MGIICNKGDVRLFRLSRRRELRCAVARALFLQRRKLRIEIGQRAIELVPIALILAHLQILLHSFAGKNQDLFPAIYLNLCLGHLGFRFTAEFQFGLLDLAFDSLAFPTSRHRTHSKRAMALRGVLFRRSFQGMLAFRFTYARAKARERVEKRTRRRTCTCAENGADLF